MEVERTTGVTTGASRAGALVGRRLQADPPCSLSLAPDRRSNFEIARIDFWRSEAYRAYFDHLDKSGGFFYERWGDGKSPFPSPSPSAVRG